MFENDVGETLLIQNGESGRKIVEMNQSLTGFSTEVSWCPSLIGAPYLWCCKSVALGNLSVCPMEEILQEHLVGSIIYLLSKTDEQCCLYIMDLLSFLPEGHIYKFHQSRKNQKIPADSLP